MSEAPPLAMLRFGRFELRPAERRLLAGGEPVPLGSRAFDLLVALASRRERIVPKDELIDVVWPGLVVEENNLQVQVSALRKVLGAPGIATVPGRGYQFTLSSSDGAAPSPVADVGPRPVASRRAVAPGRARLLVADDNKVNRLLLCRSLELMGHSVATVQNGRLALERLRAEPFDLLLLDLEMPELDGFGLLEARAAEPALGEVPVIVTSSLEGAAQVARCIELGADDYLHKPVNPVLLKARVDSSLEGKHLRDRQRELLARLAPDLSPGAASAAALPGRRAEATLLVAGLRDIDALTAAQPAQESLELLSSWATLMLDSIEEHGGTLLHLGGDVITAAFGAMAPPANHDGTAESAAQAALEMRASMAQFNAERIALGKAAPALAIGIASGAVVAGQAGTPRRAAFVCVGAVVERAAGLAALARSATAGAVLIDAATHTALAGRLATERSKPATLPGSATAVPVHALVSTA